MPSLILACPSCSQRYEYRYDSDIPSRIVCPLCGHEASCDEFSAILFCPKCYSKLDVLLECRKEDVHCPRCNTVVPFGSKMTFDDLDDSNPAPVAPTPPTLNQWLLASETLFDKYRIIKPLGRGGMAEVYLAEHILLHQNCALKILKPALFNDNPVLVKRFLREAKLAYNLNAPNIVRVFDAGTDGETGYLFLAMEFVDGQTLTNILLEKGRFSEEDLLFIARQIAQALAALEENKIVHRDIKPSNIIRSKNGEIKLTDFGIARIDASETSLTMTQATIGTPAYASPEQCTNAHQTDTRSDIYSLGATLYHLATGVPPFSGASPVEIMLNVIKKSPEPLVKKRPDLSLRTISLIEQMMAKHPSKRPQNASELLTRIKAIEQSDAAGTPKAASGANRLSMESIIRAREEAKAKNEAKVKLQPPPPPSSARIFRVIIITLSIILAILIAVCIVRFF